MTTEGLTCNFQPTWKGLHACEVTASADRSIFGSLIAENFTDRGNEMCYVEIDDTK